MSLWPEADRVVDKRIEQDKNDELAGRLIFWFSLKDAVEVTASPFCLRERTPDYITN